MILRFRLLDIDCFLTLLPILFLPLIGISLGPISFGHIAMAIASCILLLNTGLFLADIFGSSTENRTLTRLMWLAFAVPVSFLCAMQVAAAISTSSIRVNFASMGWPLIQTTAAALWFVTVARKDWSKFSLWWLFQAAGFVVLSVTAVHWLISGLPFPYIGLTHHKNNLGIASVLIGVLSMAQLFRGGSSRQIQLLSFANVCLALLLLAASVSRASLVAFAATVCVAAVLFLVQNQFRGPLLVAILIGVILLNLTIPFAYVSVAEKSRVDHRDVTGRTIYNGRETLWPIIMSQIEEQPTFGYGRVFAAQIRSYHTQEIHAHNLYMAILFQAGLFGLAFAMAFFFQIWKILEKNLSTSFGILMFGFFIGILTQNSFEVSLFYHHHSYFGIWSTLGIAVSVALAMHKQETASAFDLDYSTV